MYYIDTDRGIKVMLFQKLVNQVSLSINNSGQRDRILTAMDIFCG